MSVVAGVDVGFSPGGDIGHDHCSNGAACGPELLRPGNASLHPSAFVPEIIMHILMFLLFGLVVGAIARFLVPGRESGGWVLSIVIGVVGSMLGGFIGQFLGLYRQGQPAGFLMSLVGAIAVLALYHGVTSRRAQA